MNATGELEEGEAGRRGGPEGPAFTAQHRLERYFHHSLPETFPALPKSVFKKEFIFIMLTRYIGDTTKNETLISMTNL